MTWRANTEREGFEPPSPFGRSLSRRVQYDSASAPNYRARAERSAARPTLNGDRSGARWPVLQLSPQAQKPRTTRPPGLSPIGAPGCISLRSMVSALHSKPASRTTSRAPRLEPGTSATRTQRSTGLSHAPELTGNFNGRGGIELRSLRDPRSSPLASLAPSRTHPVIFCEDHVGSNVAIINQRTGWDSNPRGREPTRFPIVRLKPLGHPSTALRAADGHKTISFTEGVGWTLLRTVVSRNCPLRRFALPTPAAQLEPTLVIFRRKITWVRTR